MSDSLFPVPEEWKKRALMTAAQYEAAYAESLRDPDGYWGKQAARLDWAKPFTKVKNVTCDPDNLSIKWFEDGALNVSANCIDRHLAKRGDQTAIIWEGDDPKDSKKITYQAAARRSLQIRQCAEGARRQERATASPSTCR